MSCAIFCHRDSVFVSFLSEAKPLRLSLSGMPPFVFERRARVQIPILRAALFTRLCADEHPSSDARRQKGHPYERTLTRAGGAASP